MQREVIVCVISMKRGLFITGAMIMRRVSYVTGMAAINIFGVISGRILPLKYAEKKLKGLFGKSAGVAHIVLRRKTSFSLVKA